MSRIRHSKHLIEIVKDLIDNPRYGAEIGVWEGGTSTALLKQFPRLKMMMVDRYQLSEDRVQENGKSYELLTQESFDLVMMKAVESTRFAESRRILSVGSSVATAKLMGRGLFDFVFIDASHKYDSVKEDLHHWYPTVKRGGLFCGHDYKISKYRKRGKRLGVERAVNEFCDEKGLALSVGHCLIWHLIVP